MPFHLLPVSPVTHIDKIHNYYSPEVPEAQLPGYLLRSLQIGLQRRFLYTPFSYTFPGIYIYRHQRLGRFYDNISSGTQADRGLIYLIYLGLKVEV